MALPSDLDLGALRQRVGDVMLHLLHGLLGDQRPLGDIRLIAVADCQRGGGLGQPLDERVMDPRLHEDAVRADAGLARVAELGRHRAGDRQLDVRVVEDDQGGVAAELEQHALDGSRALRRQQLADDGRAGEGQRSHVGVRGQHGADLDADLRARR